MNHTLVKDLPYINVIYNRNRYVDRLYKSSNESEVYKVLLHGVKNKYINENDIVYIYCDADKRIFDNDIPVANWIMRSLGPIISQPGCIDLSLFF
jgi:hypothetical protein